MVELDPDNVEKSRTQLKKEAIALQKMGEKLVLLSDDQLKRMELPSLLMAAIAILAGNTATEDGPDTSCYSSVAYTPDVWFEWTSTFTGLCEITTCGGSTCKAAPWKKSPPISAW